MLFAAASILAAPTQSQAQISAHRSIDVYEGSVSCTFCHETAAQQVMATTHWTWEHTNTVTGQVLGKNNIINNYCIALASNEPRCTSCHVGWGYADKNFDFSNENNVDCLVCHDTTGEYKKFPTGSGLPVLDAPNEFPAGSGNIWPVVDLVKVAQNVGKTSRATCGACHFFGGGGDAVKHGDIDSSLYNPSREVDVHMGVDGLNFSCTKCHQTSHHQIPGTRYPKNYTDAKMCEGCHTTTPHAEKNPMLDTHATKVACQTCHIPAFARGSKATKMHWDWSTAGQKDASGKNMIVRNDEGEVIYDTQKGTFVWERDVVPEYLWFNGGATYVTLDDTIEPDQVVKINSLDGSRSDGKSKIFPVKRFTGKQPYDLGTQRLAIPNLFPNNAADTDAYWKGFDWDNALESGMAYVGGTFVGPVGWVDTEMYWIQNHMVAPKEKALRCADCHAETGGRLDFAGLGYSSAQVAFLQSSAPYSPQLVHAGLTGYEGSQSCTRCHSSAAHEVMATSHWTWEHTNPLTGQKLGKNKVINNYCIALASNEPRCTSCHVGWGYSDKTFDFADASKVDCLVCHDTTGEYKKFPTGSGLPVLGSPKEFPAGSGTIWPVVDLARVARNVGKTSRATCGACHFFGGGGDAVKHGDIDSSLYNPNRQVDVHMGTDGLNFTCTSCHQTEDHKIPGTRYAKDYTDAELCEKCHTSAPHSAIDVNLDNHTAKVACQTCHIPRFARGSKSTKMHWDWSTAGQKDAAGKNMIIKNETGDVIYDTQKGTFIWERDVVPEYVWFNGGATYVTLEDTIEPEQVVKINALHGSPADGKSKIFPIKRFTAKQPYDLGTKHLAIPNLFPNNASDTNAYWKGFDWENSLSSGMAYIGENWVGPVGWVESEMYWIQNHMVAPKEQALSCTDCHTSSGGRLDFAALGYGERAQALATMFEGPRFLENVHSTAGLKLRWTSTAGKSYQLLSTADLKSGAWTPVSEVLNASGASQEYTVPTSVLGSSRQLFFKIQQVP